MEKEKMTVSTRQMVTSCVFLLIANALDEMVTKIGLSLGFAERGAPLLIVSWASFWSWKWAVCFTLILFLFAVRRRAKLRWFLTQCIFLIATFLLLTQLYNIHKIITFVRGLLGQS